MTDYTTDSMKSVALVTYSKKPELFEGDNLLVESFEKHGITSVAVPWDKKGVSWENFDLVVLRSCWDYHTRILEFTAWLNKLKSQKVNLWNPINIVRWNINKKYLLDLEKMGIPIIPTKVIPNWFRDPVSKRKEMLKQVQQDLFAITNNHWEEIVIKPTFGASSYKIEKIKSNDLTVDDPRIANILNNSDVIIQPFMKEIQTGGEYSFIFFNKIYSHMILKTPKKNEYRTQPKLGGTEVTIKPNPDLISQAKKILNKINSPLLYARIDCINDKGKLRLMELELIEPYLYFEKDEESAEKFVKAAIDLGS